MPQGWLTVPNLLTIARIVGSPLAILLAWFEATTWLIVLVVFLVLTEWLDGLLARLLHQESPAGARLDTVADAIFYGSLIITTAILDPSLLTREIIWICLAIGTYGLSWLASWLKFRKFPSYHTWAAKGAWVVVGVGVVVYLIGWSAWPFRLAMLTVMLTNLEATWITLVLREARVDVPTIWHARRLTRNAADEQMS